MESASSGMTKFLPLAQPTPRDIESIGDELTALVGGGIVNPHGPTLTALIVEGSWKAGERRPILHLVLNPFSQSCNEVGTVEITTPNYEVEQLEKFFSLTFGDCPTFLIPTRIGSQSDNEMLYTKFLASFDGGLSVLEKVRRHPGDPWGRVQEDMDGLTDAIERALGGEDLEAGNRRLTQTEAKELASHLLEQENLKQEMAAFMYAWQGAVRFQEQMGGLVKTTMDFESFSALFLSIASASKARGAEAGDREPDFEPPAELNDTEHRTGEGYFEAVADSVPDADPPSDSETPQDAEELGTCLDCGHTVDDGAFCAECGSKLPSVNDPTTLRPQERIPLLSRRFLRSAWHGQESLGRVFWFGIGALIAWHTVLLVFLFGAILALPSLGTALAWFVVAVDLVLVVWWWVSVWRCAPNSDSKVWLVLARVVVLCSIYGHVSVIGRELLLTPASVEEQSARSARSGLVEPTAEVGSLPALPDENQPAAVVAEPSEGPRYIPRDVEPRIRNGVEISRTLSRDYPAAMKEAGIGGRTNLWLFVNEMGSVAETRVHSSSGYPALDEIAVQVASRMRFTPARKDGSPVSVWIVQPIDFSVTK